jgi:hypothetical protein
MKCDVCELERPRLFYESVLGWPIADEEKLDSWNVTEQSGGLDHDIETIRGTVCACVHNAHDVVGCTVSLDESANIGPVWHVDEARRIDALALKVLLHSAREHDNASRISVEKSRQ